MESGRLISPREECGDREEKEAERTRRMRREKRDERGSQMLRDVEENARARHPEEPALVMDASVSARLGCRQHGRRRSTAPSITTGERTLGNVLKIDNA